MSTIRESSSSSVKSAAGMVFSAMVEESCGVMVAGWCAWKLFCESWMVSACAQVAPATRIRVGRCDHIFESRHIFERC